MQIKAKEYVTHRFSDAETLVLAREQAAKLREISELEQQLASVSADFKGRIKAEAAAVAELRNKIESGYETREMECIVEPMADGKARIIRPDTFEVVRVRLMSDQERQMGLGVFEQ